MPFIERFFLYLVLYSECSTLLGNEPGPGVGEGVGARAGSTDEVVVVTTGGCGLWGSAAKRNT